MLTFYLLIGKAYFFLYEKTNQHYIRQYIAGNPSFAYDPTRIRDSVKELLDALTDEYSLSSVREGEKSEELSCILIDNEDSIRTAAVRDALANYVDVVEQHPLSKALTAAMACLRETKELMIDELGVNFDGMHYRMQGSDLIKGRFSLLGYALSEDTLMNCWG